MKKRKPIFEISRHYPVDLFNVKIKQMLETRVKAIKTGTEAKAFVLKAKKKGIWQAKNLDHHGNIIQLCYHGVEVALFYKRSVVEYRSEVSDPVPYVPITDPADVWVRVEFMHSKSAAKRDTYYQRFRNEVNDKLNHLKGMNKSLNIQVDMLSEQLMLKDSTIDRLRTKLQRLEGKKRRRR